MDFQAAKEKGNEDHHSGYAPPRYVKGLGDNELLIKSGWPKRHLEKVIVVRGGKHSSVGLGIGGFYSKWEKTVFVFERRTPHSVQFSV